jgi:hypothetical protein
VSCGSAGNCSAVGAYQDKSGHAQAFVVNEVNGTWGTAQEVPGTAALNTGGNADVSSVSCASAGNCSASGNYTLNSGATPPIRGFVANEVNGTWGTAQEVPGTAALNTVSCGSAGNCSAGGWSVGEVAHQSQAIVVDEVNGAWGTALEVAGALNTGGSAAVLSMSCASVGNCGAGGSYTNKSGHIQAFVVNET